jgi:hypothetical protein
VQIDKKMAEKTTLDSSTNLITSFAGVGDSSTNDVETFVGVIGEEEENEVIFVSLDMFESLRYI